MGQKRIVASAAILVLALMVAFPAVSLLAGESSTDTTDLSTTASSVTEAYCKLPLLFIENRGQVDEAVRYYVTASGQTIYFTEENIVFDLMRSDGAEADGTAERLVFSLDFLGANSQPAIEGNGKDGAVVNYLIGNDPETWYANIPSYRELIYSDIYPNIDLRLYSNGGMLRYDFVVNPGETPEVIALAYSGIDSLAIIDSELVIGTVFGDMVQSQPYIYQQIGDEVVEVEGGFRLDSDNTYGFHVAAYNTHYPLVIDPMLLDYATYLGGTDDDGGNGIAVDSNNYAYVTGHTESPNFPTKNPFQGAKAGQYDAFVTKLAQDGKTLMYSTYLGGSDDDEAYKIAVDPDGNAYVTGVTKSGNFPTKNPFQGSLNGTVDVFVTKLSPAGNVLVYSTYLGGDDIDWGYAIALDTDNYAYVTGFTQSLVFPTQNPYQPAFGGGVKDAFVTKLSQNGASLVYSTYLGGSGDELGEGIAVDSNDNAYVDGYTDSNLPTPFPTTAGAYQVVLDGEVDAFVTKLSPAGSALVYSTYLGGKWEDYAHDIALDSEGHVYTTGKTEGPGDFPITAGAFQTSFGGGNYDAFVTKLAQDGKTLVYSTYLGGDSFDLAEGIVVDPENHAYVAGETWSSTGTLPITPDAFQPAYAGNGDAFTTKLSPDGKALVYSSYLGGTGWDIGTGIALDPDDHAYVSGWTQSPDFPTTDGAFMESPGGVSYPDTWDAFAVKIMAPCDLGTDSTTGGSVTDPGEGTFTYEKGTVVDLVATPDGGYQFDNWTGDVSTIADVNDATTTITMNGDYSITAAFEETPFVQYDLSINATGGGSVTEPGEGVFPYVEGTAVDLVATPDAGYRFVEWTGNVATIANVNATSTNITMNDDYSITADFEETPSGQYDLSINSTGGGSVTEPGEGVFPYDGGTAVDLVATPSAGYRFVEWTGDVATIADVDAASTNITMSGNYSVTANFVGVEAGGVGIKAGDWIKVTYTITGLPAGQLYPEWLRLEFLSINGTIADVRATLRISNGTEQSDTGPVDVVSGSEVPGLAGIAISANRTTGDSVYIAGYGNVTIAGEVTRTYAGANRTVVYASFSQNETQVTYYWDKLTGVMVEISSTSPDITATAKATETNMWGATTVRMPWWPWIIVGVVVVGLVIFFLRRRRAARPEVQAN
jgi:hypothetical protein